MLAREEHIPLFEKYNVLTRRESLSRSNVLHTGYAHRIAVEALSMLQIAGTSILPAAAAYQKNLADSINATRAASAAVDLSDQENLLGDVATSIGRLKVGIDRLRSAHERSEEIGDDPVAAAVFGRDELRPAMTEVRRQADHLETLVDDGLWPLPKYHELLFLH